MELKYDDFYRAAGKPALRSVGRWFRNEMSGEQKEKARTAFAVRAFEFLAV